MHTLTGTEITTIIGNITAGFGIFFAAIALLLAVVAGNNYAFKMFKKVFPNAKR